MLVPLKAMVKFSLISKGPGFRTEIQAQVLVLPAGKSAAQELGKWGVMLPSNDTCYNHFTDKTGHPNLRHHCHLATLSRSYSL